MHSIEELTRQLGSPDPSKAHEARQTLRAIVWRATNPASSAERTQVAEALAAALAQDHEALVTSELCQLLSLVGGDAQVPALVALLADASTWEVARCTLARLDGPAATAALAAAARTGTPAEFRVGTMNSLAACKSKDGVAVLVESLESDDLEVRLAAAEALAEHGRDDLDERIARVDTAGSERAARRIARARVRLAASIAKDGNKQAALEIFKRLTATAVPPAQRKAAQRALDGLG